MGKTPYGLKSVMKYEFDIDMLCEGAIVTLETNTGRLLKGEVVLTTPDEIIIDAGEELIDYYSIKYSSLINKEIWFISIDKPVITIDENLTLYQSDFSKMVDTLVAEQSNHRDISQRDEYDTYAHLIYKIKKLQGVRE